MQKDQMNADADRAWECLVPTCCTKALQQQKLQGAGWDNGPHSVTGRRSTKFVLSEFSVLPPIFHHGNVNETIRVLGNAGQPVDENTGQAAAELGALLPAILDRAFKGKPL